MPGPGGAMPADGIGCSGHLLRRHDLRRHLATRNGPQRRCPRPRRAAAVARIAPTASGPLWRGGRRPGPTGGESLRRRRPGGVGPDDRRGSNSDDDPPASGIGLDGTPESRAGMVGAGARERVGGDDTLDHVGHHRRPGAALQPHRDGARARGRPAQRPLGAPEARRAAETRNDESASPRGLTENAGGFGEPHGRCFHGDHPPHLPRQSPDEPARQLHPLATLRSPHPDCEWIRGVECVDPLTVRAVSRRVRTIDG